MEVGFTWNKCLLCSVQLTTEDGRTSLPFKRSQNPLVGMLIGIGTGAGDNDKEGKRLYKDIMQLTKRTTQGDRKVGLRFCAECETTANQLMGMQVEVDMIQTRMVEKLRNVIQVGIANSKLHGVQQEFDKVDKTLEQMEKKGMDCGVGRQVLEVLTRVQRVIFEKDLESLHVPPVGIHCDSQDAKLQVETGARKDNAAEKVKNGVGEPTDDGVESEEVGHSIIQFSGCRLSTEKVQDEGYVQTRNYYTAEDLVGVRMETDETGGEFCVGDKEETEDLSKFDNEVEYEVMQGDDDTLDNNLRDLAEGSADCLTKNPSAGVEKNENEIEVLQSCKGQIKMNKVEAQEPQPALDLNDEKKMKSPVEQGELSRRHDRFKCELCQFSTRSYCAAQQHVHMHEESGGEKTLECTKCLARFVHRSSLKRHVHTHSPYYNRNCDVCGKRVHLEKMESHLKIHSKIYYCEFCDFFCGTYNGLIMHIKFPAKKPFQVSCKLCSAEEENPNLYTTKISLLKHLEEHHGYSGIYLKCDYPDCDKEFLYRNDMNKHKQGHSNHTKCNVCGNVYANNSGLREHIRQVHEKIKAYKCNLCPQHFSSRLGLLGHQRAKHGREKLKCDLCPDKKYNSYTGLYHHMKRCHADKTRKDTLQHRVKTKVPTQLLPKD